MAKSLHRSLEAKLAALDGPEWDSSDDEENVQMLSQVKESGKKKKGGKSGREQSASANSDGDKKVAKKPSTNNNNKPSSVIYLGHLPPGFEEGEIRGFLTQFGSIRKLRLSRSKKTANSRGYAFVEFVDPEVASIVADTMSGYFLMEKRLVCHVLPRDKCHPNLFDGHQKKFIKVDWQGINREQVNKPRTAEGMKKITARLVKREAEKRKKLEALGIDYDFPGYEAGAAKSAKTKADSETKGSSKRKRKSSKDEAEAEAKTPKRRERKGSEVSTDGESSVKKSSKKSAKKQRKGSAELDVVVEEVAETPKKAKKKGTSKHSAKTEVKKAKKKSSKKRRDSVP